MTRRADFMSSSAPSSARGSSRRRWILVGAVPIVLVALALLWITRSGSQRPAPASSVPARTERADLGSLGAEQVPPAKREARSAPAAEVYEHSALEALRLGDPFTLLVHDAERQPVPRARVLLEGEETFVGDDLGRVELPHAPSSRLPLVVAHPDHGAWIGQGPKVTLPPLRLRSVQAVDCSGEPLVGGYVETRLERLSLGGAFQREATRFLRDVYPGRFSAELGPEPVFLGPAEIRLSGPWDTPRAMDLRLRCERDGFRADFSPGEEVRMRPDVVTTRVRAVRPDGRPYTGRCRVRVGRFEDEVEADEQGGIGLRNPGCGPPSGAFWVLEFVLGPDRTWRHEFEGDPSGRVIEVPYADMPRLFLEGPCLEEYEVCAGHEEPTRTGSYPWRPAPRVAQGAPVPGSFGESFRWFVRHRATEILVHEEFCRGEDTRLDVPGCASLRFRLPADGARYTFAGKGGSRVVRDGEVLEVPVGSYEYELLREWSGFVETAWYGEVEPGHHVIEVEPTGARWIEGSVHGASRGPLAGVRVLFEGESSAATATDASGRYRLRGEPDVRPRVFVEGARWPGEATLVQAHGEGRIDFTLLERRARVTVPDFGEALDWRLDLGGPADIDPYDLTLPLDPGTHEHWIPTVGLRGGLALPGASPERIVPAGTDEVELTWPESLFLLRVELDWSEESGAWDRRELQLLRGDERMSTASRSSYAARAPYVLHGPAGESSLELWSTYRHETRRIQTWRVRLGPDPWKRLRLRVER